MRRTFKSLIVAASVFAGSMAVAQDAESPAAEAAPEAAAEPSKDAVAAAEPKAEASPLFTLNPGELDILRRLADRRRELDAREAKLVERERLAAALEAKLVEQAAELKKLRQALKLQEDQLAATKNAVEGTEGDRIQKLAKAYKAMKPKDAARLFNEMDMKLLAAIAKEISPRTLAPVMAKMDAEKAMALTRALKRG